MARAYTISAVSLAGLLLALGIVHFGSGASGCIRPPSSVGVPLSASDYAVYGAVLSRFAAGGEPPRLAVHEDAGWEWSDRRTFLEPARALSGSTRELTCSFAARNREIQRLDPAAFPQDVSVAVVTPAVLDSLFGPGEPDPWERLFSRYPGSPGLLRVSGVGFDRYGTRALLGVDLTCGILCGEGQILLLVLVEGRWTVLESVRIWVS